jgi:hypothetical protein
MFQPHLNKIQVNIHVHEVQLTINLPIRIITKRPSSASSSKMFSNIWLTNFPDSEKYLENKLWLFISTNLHRWNCLDNRIESFWANARLYFFFMVLSISIRRAFSWFTHDKLVFPEPGGPCKRMSLQSLNINISVNHRSVDTD